MRVNNLVIALLLSVLITVFTMSSAIGISFIFFHLIGVITCIILAENSKEKNDLFGIYFGVFTVYTIYILIAHAGYLENGNFFIYPDQGYFYPNIDALSSLPSISSIFKETIIDRVHIDYEGFFFFQGTIAYIAENYFSGNSVLLQSAHIAFYGILINLFVYKILTKYVPRKIAIKYTMIFAFFTPLFYYSPWILRDVPIAFFYAVAVYFTHTKFRLVVFIYYSMLVLITMEFRVEHGLFLLVFPFLYIYINKASNVVSSKLWPFILVLSIAVFIGVFYIFIEEFTNSMETLRKYDDYTIESLNDGFGAQLYKLPNGVRQLLVSLNSQVTPLPPWAGISLERSTLIVITSLVQMINTIYWSYIFIFSVYALFSRFVRGKLSQSLWIFLIVFILFLLFNSANMNVRRILGVYPILFILYVILNTTILSAEKRKRFSRYSVITYGALLIMYVVLKAFL